VKPPIVAPLTTTQYKVQCTISGDTYEKLRRAQDLLRHTIPNGDPAAILDRALTLLVADLEKKKIAATAQPRTRRDGATRSRHVPAAVKREVWKRDGGQCAFEGTNGRCAERGFLEFHHVVPYAMGGETATTNLQLRCKAHNAYEAEQDFKPWLIREAADRWLSAVCQLGPDRGPGARASSWTCADDTDSQVVARRLDVTPTTRKHAQEAADSELDSPNARASAFTSNRRMARGSPSPSDGRRVRSLLCG
jgi:hypothetical protein